MFLHVKDFAKVGAAFGSNVVAAAAKAAVTEPGQLVLQENIRLHDLLTFIQIGVGLVTIAYVGLKLFRLWRNKKATS
jgi:hypothetical protein